MGLIKAIFGGITTTLADQWKELIYCDSMSADVLMAKGQAAEAPIRKETRT